MKKSFIISFFLLLSMAGIDVALISMFKNFIPPPPPQAVQVEGVEESGEEEAPVDQEEDRVEEKTWVFHVWGVVKEQKESLQSDTKQPPASELESEGKKTDSSFKLSETFRFKIKWLAFCFISVFLLLSFWTILQDVHLKRLCVVIFGGGAVRSFYRMNSFSILNWIEYNGYTFDGNFLLIILAVVLLLYYFLFTGNKLGGFKRNQIFIMKEQSHFFLYVLGGYLAQMVLLGFFSWFFLKVLFDSSMENMSPEVQSQILVMFLVMFFCFSICVLLYLSLLIARLSNRIYGPVYGFQKYVRDVFLFKGPLRSFKLREGDHFRDLVWLAKDLQEKYRGNEKTPPDQT